MFLLSNRPTELKSADLIQEVSGRVRRGDLESFVLVVPSSALRRKLERDLVFAAEGRALTTPHVHTIATFASSLLSVGEPQLRVISDAESGIFIEEAIRTLFDDGELRYFERREEKDSNDPRLLPLPRGTFEMVLNTIRQLKQNGVYPKPLYDQVREALRLRGETTEVRRARDIQAIYARYEERLGDIFTDTYGQFHRLNTRYQVSPIVDANLAMERVTHDVRRAFGQARDLFFTGFQRLEEPALQLIVSLAQIDSVNMTIALDATPDNQELFATTSDLASQLATAGFEIAEFDAALSPLQTHLSQSLFNTEAREQLDVRESIRVLPARSPLEEVEAVAREVKLLLAREPDLLNDLSRVAVVCYREQAYTDLFREVFRRFEIPANIIDRHKLDNAPLMLGVLSLLEIASRGLRRRDVLRALTSPYFKFTSKTGERIDTGNLLTVIKEQRLIGEATNWHDELRAHQAVLDERQQELDENPDEFEQRDLDRERAMTTKALQDLATLNDLLRPFVRKLAPREFSHQLRLLFTRLQLGEQLLCSSSATIAAGTLELDARSYRSFVKLIEDLDGLFRLMGIEEEELPVSFYVERLRTASIWTRFNPKVRQGAVYVASIEQTAGLDFDHVFFVGLVDGMFPSVYEPQVFLMDSMQKGERRQLLEERLMFYTGVTLHRQSLTLTYPERSEGGAEQTRSSFLTALKDICVVQDAIVETEGLFNYNDLYLLTGDLLRNDERERSLKLLDDNSIVPASSFYRPVLSEAVPAAYRMEKLRVSKTPSEFSGMIDRDKLSDAELRTLDQFQTQVWSITQLESYAVCPFQYFAKYVLRLGETDVDEEGLSASERGSFLHEVLREFFTKRRDNKALALQDLDQSGLDNALIEMRGIADAMLDRASMNHPFWKLDSERIMGTAGEEGVLERFIRKEKELEPFTTRPRFFEVSFGGKTGSKKEIDSELVHDDPIDIGGIKLRGKIDRIDVSPDHFAIIDYKSGKSVKKRKDVDRGISLQLPLYLKVAEDLLRQYFQQLEGVAALYHKVMDKNSKRELGLAVKTYMKQAFEDFKGNQKGLLGSTEELQNLVESTIARTRLYVEGIAAGHFPLIASDLQQNHCKYCSFSPACRVKSAVDNGVLLEWVDSVGKAGDSGADMEPS